MAHSVDLYDSAYALSSAELYRRIRGETYGQDLGQTGWMTADELRGYADLLQLSAASRVLEVGCGAGGCAIFLAQTLGAAVTGIDVNEAGIRNANELAQVNGIASRVRFTHIEAGSPLPFEKGSFDAVFSNDAMCHIPDRLDTLREWHRVLRPGGRILFTDAMIVTGILTSEEIATRSSIGFYLFLPPGENERLIAEAGFELLVAMNVTQSSRDISGRWFEARSRFEAELLRIEGESKYAGLQKFLGCVRQLTGEQRLSRFLYAASRPA